MIELALSVRVSVKVRVRVRLRVKVRVSLTLIELALSAVPCNSSKRASCKEWSLSICAVDAAHLMV